ncbi:MAG: type effector Hrp-dependent outer protein [Clostridia bacterium]|jgi:uncharacterized protein YgbK (DUF1537 family)|nr:type effector Hrp-dependent outer protein [Clostridia bacterium]
MSKIIIGCVGDDFSGSSDAASFFANEGIKTLLFNGTPKEDVLDLDEDIAVVIALKTRTEETSKAVADTMEALEWLKRNGAEQLFIKYCSTFDSTKEGNIGPIVDSALEKYNIKYTILCPALPVNGRTVVNGHLFVNGVPLHETHMKDHPLTPMWDSDIAKLMEPQGKYSSLKINSEMLEKSKEEILKVIEAFGCDKEHFYVIPDYSEEKHADKIVEVFGDLQLLTGGSGLMTQLSYRYTETMASKSEKLTSPAAGRAIVLAGSCSKATLGQIEDFKSRHGKYIKIDPKALMEGSQTKEELWSFVEAAGEDTVLVYSSDNPENVKEAQKAGSHIVSGLLEQTTAYLAKKASENGFDRIIVAGGETSGAVTKILGYDSYLVGESIAPGVPIMIPLKNRSLRLVLKSGNFGQRDFFERAISMTKENANG